MNPEQSCHHLFAVLQFFLLVIVCLEIAEVPPIGKFRIGRSVFEGFVKGLEKEAISIRWLCQVELSAKLIKEILNTTNSQMNIA